MKDFGDEESPVVTIGAPMVFSIVLILMILCYREAIPGSHPSHVGVYLPQVVEAATEKVDVEDRAVQKIVARLAAAM
ncbi:hypothetical protein [Pararhizobium sp. DWP1-1-3]|uniref:hypothetical protein n=1 Tax=Pararhizobium sp. DWP1-1-3 TaxID=2804652 RepID=UPI003CED079E